MKSALLIMTGIVIGFVAGLKALPALQTIVHGEEKPYVLTDGLEFFSVPKETSCSAVSPSTIKRGGLVAGTPVRVRRQGRAAWLTMTVVIDEPLPLVEANDANTSDYYRCQRAAQFVVADAGSEP